MYPTTVDVRVHNTLCTPKEATQYVTMRLVFPLQARWADSNYAFGHEASPLLGKRACSIHFLQGQNRALHKSGRLHVNAAFYGCTFGDCEIEGATLDSPLVSVTLCTSVARFVQPTHFVRPLASTRDGTRRTDGRRN